MTDYVTQSTIHHDGKVYAAGSRITFGDDMADARDSLVAAGAIVEYVPPVEPAPAVAVESGEAKKKK